MLKEDDSIRMMKNLCDILLVPDSQRDQKWEKIFFDAFLQSKVNIVSEQPQTGPDGWPYLLVSTDETAKEPTSKLLSWLSQKGVGLVVNPQKDFPDYIFTWGMIWYQKHRGLFQVDKTIDSTSNLVTDNCEIKFGPPSNEYLPIFVRKIIKKFLLDQGILEPRWVMGSDRRDCHDLCFSLESLGNPIESEHKGIAEALSWFLPQHYSVVLVSESQLIKVKFFEFF